MLRREIIDALTGFHYPPLSYDEAKTRWWPNILSVAAGFAIGIAVGAALRHMLPGITIDRVLDVAFGAGLASTLVVNQRLRRRVAERGPWREALVTWLVLAVGGTAMCWLLTYFGVLAA